ncbi:hypothetical protein FD737_10105 [Pantoea sp. Seng]|uniref:hypothetical protein n=1 Tax=Pantoea sp. Seng TaxID=2576761 RepID=UPI00132BC9D3|nr:hypothetical protein [Pantoea sp. Seng]MXP53432.1 hypothetical protein [Pantoea sp. Seng]
MRFSLNFFVLILFIASSNAIASPGKYEVMASDLMDKQKFQEWKPKYSAAPFFVMNGRFFYLTINDFADIVRNTFAQCDDFDAYYNQKGATDRCKAHIYQGMVEWVELSRDKSVSEHAWSIGVNYAFDTSNPVASKNVWDFNGWAAGIRVAKSKGY